MILIIGLLPFQFACEQAVYQLTTETLFREITSFVVVVSGIPFAWQSVIRLEIKRHRYRFVGNVYGNTQGKEYL